MKTKSIAPPTRLTAAALAVVAMLCATSSLRAQPTTAETEAEMVKDRYIVVLQDGSDAPGIAGAHAQIHGFAHTHVYQHALKGYAAKIPADKLAAIKTDPRVQYVAEDRVIHADSNNNDQHILDPAAIKYLQQHQVLPTGINRIEAEKSSTISGDAQGTVDVGIAIIDTGIQPDHPDLNVVGGVDATGNRKGSFEDKYGHGTHVAGIAAARDNGFGVVGVAPGARLYSVKVFDNQLAGYVSDAVYGIDWVTANAAALNIKVANMSWGSTGSDDGNCGKTNHDPLHTAICNLVAAGVTCVAAAGNGLENSAGVRIGIDLANTSPASYNEVLSVTSVWDIDGQPGGLFGAYYPFPIQVDCTRGDDGVPVSSNFTTVGSDDVEHTIAAPGMCILSTYLGSAYSFLSGTSMATPHVAGTIALGIASGKLRGTPQQIMAQVLRDAKQQPASYGFHCDPNDPCYENGQTLYIGNLVYAGGY